MIEALKIPLDKTNMSAIAEHAGKANLTIDLHSTFLEINRGNDSIRISSDHIYYLQDVVDNFDFHFTAVEPVTVDGKTLVDYSTPRMHWVRGFDLFPVMCNSVVEPMVTTEQYVDVAQLPKGGVVIDLGGFTGLTSIAFALAVGKTGRVICVEADQKNQAVTRNNLALYAKLTLDGAPIALEEKAAWNHNDGIPFSTDGNMGATAAAIVSRGEISTVASITLSEIVKKHGLERLDFIKCDIEGAEAVVFQNEQELLRKFRPRIVIEPHYINEKLSTPMFRPHLEAAEYQLTEIVQHGGFPLPLIVAVPVEAVS
jgi:FkbM family methyltransferase